VSNALGEYKLFDKFTFSAYKDKDFRTALEESGRKTVVIAGVESHVCVEQTALDLVEAGYDEYKGIGSYAVCCRSSYNMC